MLSRNTFAVTRTSAIVFIERVADGSQVIDAQEDRLNWLQVQDALQPADLSQFQTTGYPPYSYPPILNLMTGAI